MGIEVTLETAPFSCATVDGRRLEITTDLVADFDLQIAYQHPTDDEDELPWSVLASHLRFVDNAGNGWQIISRFPTSLLIRSMMDFSAHVTIRPWAASDPDFKSEFDRGVILRDAFFSSDDRMIRSLIVGESLRDVQFKYTVISFDLAVFLDDMYEVMGVPDVFARTSQLFDYEAAAISPLVFPVNFNCLLTNTMYMADGEWMESAMPIPFVAEPAEVEAEPQENVILTGNAT